MIGCFYSRLQHSSNTVMLQAVYEDYYNVYIAMEDCKGGDLEQLLDVSLKRCPPPADTRLSFRRAPTRGERFLPVTLLLWMYPLSSALSVG